MSFAVKVNALRELQSATGEELSPPFHYGDATQSALRPYLIRRLRESCDRKASRVLKELNHIDTKGSQTK